MSKYAEYSRTAEECSKMADTAITEAERRAWLKLCESWLRLARTIATEQDTEELATPPLRQTARAQNGVGRHH